ncbi:MAG: class I tRNA ligase family protein, partial [Gemmatimonadetes bacterium]|nr:class I tRNA ligase family protein [Gemmatimonadota bacterium]NIU78945.1 class I tRNA ligase family protein [Gammaproteobacteria bacterium]NIQ58775.1 class I tRNA ligase family protein [Gemmatimonadota bacterium]NIW35787.1 class I tRNA ligase family protein [Gemmatimonadota bacterium]NIW77005.1 class I tRNA ligase family protein [Gemmatimonadota bacterium]
TVWAHGYINWEGRKLSKSAGLPVTLQSATERHGPDALRYFLLREVPWDGDGDFTWERFDDRYTAELANDLGNLANRSLSMIDKYRDSTIPAGGATALDRDAEAVLETYTSAMDAHRLHRAIAAAMDLADKGNLFIEETAPWSLAKDESEADRLDDVLGGLARALGRLAILLSPFMPEKMAELWRALGG